MCVFELAKLFRTYLHFIRTNNGKVPTTFVRGRIKECLRSDECFLVCWHSIVIIIGIAEPKILFKVYFIILLVLYKMLSFILPSLTSLSLAALNAENLDCCKKNLLLLKYSKRLYQFWGAWGGGGIHTCITSWMRPCLRSYAYRWW